MPAIAAFGMALGGVPASQASTVTITVTGTVLSGEDTTGVFGFAPGTQLAGKSYTVVFTFDDTQGQQLFSAVGSNIVSTANSSPGSAVLKIGSGAYTFATIPVANNASELSLASDGVDNSSYFLEADSGPFGAEWNDIQGTVEPASGTVLTTSANWENPLSDCDLASGAGDYAFYFGIRQDAENRAASGYLTASCITVSGPQGTPALAKSFGGTGGNNICGCIVQVPAPQYGVSDPDVGNTGMAQVAQPIEVGSGNMFHQIVDYSTAGPNPLQFIRYYNSMEDTAGVNTLASSLGVNWRSNYDRYLRLGPTSVSAERPDGQILTFSLRGATWISDSDADYVLKVSGSTWTLTDHDDTVETYTTTTGTFYDLAITYGKLDSIKQRNGYTQTLSSSGDIVTVTDSYGRSLELTFANGLLDTVKTPDTLVLTYGIAATSGGKRLTSVSYNTAPSSSQTYLYEDPSFPFALTGIIDEDNKRYATWAYDASGRAKSSQLGSGANLTTVSYNSDGSSTVTNAFGVADTYTFALLDGVQKVVEIDRAATSTTASARRVFTYDGYGYLNSATDWDGNQTTYLNDAQGDPTTIYEAANSPVARTTTIVYDKTWVHEPHQIVTSGLTSTFTYDGHGNPLTRNDADTTANTVPYSTNGQTRVTTWTWSSTGQETSIRLPRTDVTAKTGFSYDSTGALIQITDALGHLTKITAHTGGGLPTTIVDPNNVTTTLKYDARLNLNTSTLTTTAGKLTTTWTHDAANNLTAVQLPDNSKLAYGYDTAHRLTSVTDLLGNSVAYTLDALGDKTLVQTKNTSSVLTRKHSAKFDALGRMLADIGGVGQTTTYKYDLNGNVLTVTPPSPSGAINYTYDGLNRQATRVDPAPGGTTSITYDAHDRLLSVKDANGNTTTYVNDGFGDRTQTASPDSGTTIYQYDADGNLTQSVKPGPLTANFTYDALDRNKTVKYLVDATLSVSRAYDQTGHGFGVGRLTSITDQVGSVSLTYDERANVKNETRIVTGAGTLTTATSYDNAGRVSEIAYPSGTVVAYGHDTMGRVISVIAKLPGSTTASNVVTGITYEPFGPETALSFGNGIAGTYGYDLDYRPTTRVESGSAAVQNLTYGYYTNNSVMTITDALNAANTQTLGYDALDRLTSAKSGARGYGAFGYTWDPVGNITTEVVNGTKTTYTPVTGSNRLSQWVTGSTTEAVGSTPAGNINTFTVGTTALDTLSYNQANQLSSAASTTSSATYKYDFAGQRMEKALPGSYPILYEYGITDGALLSENDLHKGQTADYIYLNGRPIAEVNPTTGKLYFSHTDRLGTPQKLTDSTQNLAWTALYQPFGGTGASVSGLLTIQSLRSPGQQFDSETGLYHNGFRDYAPGLTRYVESDPIGLAGGVNLYEYAGSNPYSAVDPTGTTAWTTVANKLFWFGVEKGNSYAQDKVWDKEAFDPLQAQLQAQLEPLLNDQFNDPDEARIVAAGLAGATCESVKAFEGQPKSPRGFNLLGYLYNPLVAGLQGYAQSAQQEFQTMVNERQQPLFPYTPSPYYGSLGYWPPTISVPPYALKY